MMFALIVVEAIRLKLVLGTTTAEMDDGAATMALQHRTRSVEANMMIYSTSIF